MKNTSTRSALAVLFSLVALVAASDLAKPWTPPMARRRLSIDVPELNYTCEPPENAVETWWLGDRLYGPYSCTYDWTTWGKVWSMLRAYRAGGVENIHWKYTDDKNDPACMNGWTYYDKGGKKVIGKVWGRTTFLNEQSRWCALPHYRQGYEGYQFEWCNCKKKTGGQEDDPVPTEDNS